jgi:hypothetical protein
MDETIEMSGTQIYNKLSTQPYKLYDPIPSYDPIPNELHIHGPMFGKVTLSDYTYLQSILITCES